MKNMFEKFEKKTLDILVRVQKLQVSFLFKKIRARAREVNYFMVSTHPFATFYWYRYL